MLTNITNNLYTIVLDYVLPDWMQFSSHFDTKVMTDEKPVSDTKLFYYSEEL